MQKSKKVVERAWWGEDIEYDYNIKPKTIEDIHREMPSSDNNYYTGKEDIWIKKEYFDRTVDGKIVQICRTTKYRRYLYEKRVYNNAVNRRKTWVKFGECKGKEPGLEDNISYSGKFVKMDDPTKIVKKKEVEVSTQKWKPKNIKYASKVADTKTKYVPPCKRAGYKSKYKDAKTTIRISNLNLDTEYQDLKELCKKYGSLVYVKMIKNHSDQFKGYAFVEYRSSKSAKNAIDKLDGKRLDHCVIHVSYAKPRK